MKKAIVTGIRGQDGAYLAKLLLEKGYEVYGADRRRADLSNWRLSELGICEDVKFVYMDLIELTNIMCVIKKIEPDEIYNLAAQSFVGASFDQPLLTSEVNGMGVLRVLESIKTINPKIKFYQASTSEMFGKAQEIPQTEKTPFYPRSPYAVAKLFGHWIATNYREAYNLFTCSGILFNHESPLRGMEFVTRKITYGVARIKEGLQNTVVLGNLDTKRDWGYAKEYVEGAWLMMQQETPEDYVLATGETHTVREFVEKACLRAGFTLNWTGTGVDTKGVDAKTGKTLIEVSPEFYRPADVDVLLGNPQKAKTKLGWEPKVKFEELVGMMVDEDLKRVKREKSA